MRAALLKSVAIQCSHFPHMIPIPLILSVFPASLARERHPANLAASAISYARKAPRASRLWISSKPRALVQSSRCWSLFVALGHSHRIDRSVGGCMISGCEPSLGGTASGGRDA